MSLKARTTLALLVPVLGCLTVFGTFAYLEMRGTMLESKLEQLESIADLKKAQVERLLDTYRHDTGLAVGLVVDAVEAEPAGLQSEGVAALLRRMLESNEELAAIHLMDPTGIAAASTVAEMIGAQGSAGLGPFDSASVVTAGITVRPFLLDQGGPPRTLVLAPIAGNGGYHGLLVARFRVASLRVAIETGAFSETGELLLAMRDENGDVRLLADVLHGEDAEGSVPALGRRPDIPMNRALEGHNARWVDGMKDYAGNDVIAVTRYLDELDWGLAAGIDLAEAIAPARSLRNVLLVLALALAGMLVAVGRYLGESIMESNSLLEQELVGRSAAERRFQGLVASSPSAMLALQLEPGSGAVGGIELANREARKLLGHQHESMFGWGPTKWLHEDSGDAFARLVRSALKSDEAMDEECARADLVVVHADGSEVEVEVGVVPFEGEAGVLLLVTMVDLTERKRTARALQRHAEELARSNRDLDDFAYVASHDLKAPLRAVVQLATFIEEDAGPTMPAQSLSDLQLLRGRAERLDRLLGGLLEYSRIGRGAGEAEVINTEEVLREVQDLYVPADRFEVVVDGTLENVVAPRAAFHLVLRNLVMNAVKHHDRPHGLIRVSARRAGSFVHLRVEDDGPGIPVEYAARIFKIFETLRPRDQVEGNGLGLPMIKRTVESLGGSVTVDLEPGRGAVFEVLWPVRPQSRRVRDAA